MLSMEDNAKMCKEKTTLGQRQDHVEIGSD